MKHIVLIILVSFFNVSTSFCQSIKTTSITPNIVFLLADDLGYGELGCYGQETVKTPHLDALAAKGMRFTNFYAGNAVCSPSRAVLMTGISSPRNTIRGNLGVFNNTELERVALKKDEVTLGDMLKKNAYQTAFIGKWHLEDPNDLETWAYSRGFDYAIQEQWGDKKGGLKFQQDTEYVSGMQDSIHYDYKKYNSKDEFRTDLAFKYLDGRDKEKPFFLFMSYRAPHGHERVIGNETLYADQGWPENERIHAAKITLLDAQIGRLIKKLEALGELDNTLILFTSDNGPHGEGIHDYEFFNSNGALRGFKRDLYEGGIRVPLIAYWKDKIQPGVVTDHAGSFQDIMPTLAEVSKTAVPEASNGLSILPVLLGKTPNKHEFLNWEILVVAGKNGPKDQLFRQSARIDQWKGVRYGATYNTQLYNLDEDPGETRDIASEYPEMVARMNTIFKNERTESEHYPYNGLTKK